MPPCCGIASNSCRKENNDLGRQSNRSTTVFSAKQRDYWLCCPQLVGQPAAKKRCLPKISDRKREDFFVLEVEERSNTGVLQVMRQTKRGNIPFQEPLYSACFVYAKTLREGLVPPGAFVISAAPHCPRPAGVSVPQSAPVAG